MRTGVVERTRAGWVLALFGAGACYLSHERPTEGSTSTECREYGRTIDVVARDGPQRLQGDGSAIAPTRAGFGVSWIVNDGGIFPAVALYDSFGTLIHGPTVVTIAEGRDTDAVTLVSHEDGVRLFWLGESGAYTARFDESSDSVWDVQPLELGTVGQRVPFQATPGPGDEPTLLFASDAGPAVVAVDSSGAAGPRRLLTSERPEWTWAVGVDDDAATVAWAAREPSDDDVVFVQRSAGEPPMELVRSENAMLSFYGTPVIRRDGSAFVGVSRLEDALVVRVESGSFEPIPLGRDFPWHPVLFDGGDRPMVVSADVPEALGGLRAALAVRSVDASDRVSTPVILEELPASCGIERYYGASRADALAVLWMDNCGSRALRMRICRR